MSVETTSYRMPQPEQWLSEHEPWSTFGIVFFTMALVLLIGWLA